MQSSARGRRIGELSHVDRTLAPANRVFKTVMVRSEARVLFSTSFVEPPTSALHRCSSRLVGSYNICPMCVTKLVPILNRDLCRFRLRIDFGVGGNPVAFAAKRFGECFLPWLPHFSACNSATCETCFRGELILLHGVQRGSNEGTGFCQELDFCQL